MTGRRTERLIDFLEKCLLWLIEGEKSPFGPRGSGFHRTLSQKGGIDPQIKKRKTTVKSPGRTPR
jgi:hypothetical protein